MNDKTNRVGRPFRAVRNLTTGQLYDSVADAATAFGVSPSYISTILNGHRPGFTDHRLAYEDGRGAGRHRLRVRASGRRTTDILFPLTLGKPIYDRLMTVALHSGSAPSHVGAQAILYFLDALESGVVVLEPAAKDVGKPGRPVVELNTKLIFESATAAGRHFKISGSTVSLAANGHHRNSNGLRFQYLDDPQKGALMSESQPEAHEAQTEMNAPASNSVDPTHHPKESGSFDE